MNGSLFGSAVCFFSLGRTAVGDVHSLSDIHDDVIILSDLFGLEPREVFLLRKILFDLFSLFFSCFTVSSNASCSYQCRQWRQPTQCFRRLSHELWQHGHFIYSSKKGERLSKRYFSDTLNNVRKEINLTDVKTEQMLQPEKVTNTKATKIMSEKK